VDGLPAGSGDIRDGEITFNLSKGEHSLAFFTTHDGRDKLAAYLGSMDSVDRKGIFGNAILRKGGPSIVTLRGWHFLKASSDAEFPAPGTAGWKDYTIGDDAFDHKEGYGWFRTVLTDPAAGIKQIVLKFKSVDENATVFINGRKVGRHEGWNQPFEVVLDRLDSVQRPLELTLYVENYSNEGGIDRPVRANYAGSGEVITGWCMRGGVGDPAGIMDWRLLPIGTACVGPCWYRSVFIIPGYGVSGAHPIWRVHTEGLGHGSVWVNGHNLGRYPEKTNAPGLYIPECWLKAGRNTLIILDDDGRSPDAVSVQAEVAAGRDLTVFSNE
jgi:beta-galactosidase